MTAATSTITPEIAVDALRIGMFIHLDVGWMSHPFPLSSFRISSDEQIGIIRSLGIRQLRWSPEQSALHDAQDRAAADAALSRIVEQAGQPAPTESPEAAAGRERRAAAAAQRAALALCERQFAEATRECKALTEMVVARPQEASGRAHALTQAFVDKMLGAQDICIRLLTDAAGDRASSHAVNVTLISLLMGRSFGLSALEMLDLGIGALLHDIGKLDLPPRVRHREEHFSAAELKFYEEHVTHGVAHALKMGLSPGASLVIAQHHEHADG